MQVSKRDIEQYIPQRNPVVMVDALVSADEQKAVSQLYVDSGNIFQHDGFFSEPGLIENIAQTAALHAGYGSHLQNKPVPLGFIAAIRNLVINTLPATGSTITTEVKIVNNVFNVTIIEGRITQDNREICSCEMRIFIQQ